MNVNISSKKRVLEHDDIDEKISNNNNKKKQRASCDEISGLRLIPDFISEDEEAKLIKLLDKDFASNWSNELSRRVQHYGYHYDYKKRSLDQINCKPIPKEFAFIQDRLTPAHFDKRPDQLIVNEYYAGQGINAHIDHKKSFGDQICSLSLGLECMMVFKTNKHDCNREVWIKLPRRSLLMMEGEARHEWTHEIPKLSGKRPNSEENQFVPEPRRISFTWRNVKKSDRVVVVDEE